MIRLTRALLFVFITVLMISSCQKIQEDHIPPVIILIGRNPDTVLVGCTYDDPGAFYADDNGTKAAGVSGIVNTDSAGIYFRNYTAFDADSNMAVEQRKVIVESLGPEYYEGVFTAIDTLVVIPRQVTSYNVSISRLSQNQNIFRISNFNNLGEDFELVFQPDSSGSFQLSYDNAGTVINGQGWVKCTSDGLRMNYTVALPDDYQTHKATYRN